MKPAIYALAAFALILAAAPAWAKEPKIGEPAPDFQVETFDGKKLSLADFKGQVVILNFWATWCTPCRKELPTLDTYYRLRKDAGLAVLAIATEHSVSDVDLKPLSRVLSFPMVRRIKGPYHDMHAIPTNFVIDRAGVLRYAKADAFDLDKLNAILAPLLSEPPPPADPGQSRAP